MPKRRTRDDDAGDDTADESGDEHTDKKMKLDKTRHIVDRMEGLVDSINKKHSTLHEDFYFDDSIRSIPSSLLLSGITGDTIKRRLRMFRVECDAIASLVAKKIPQTESGNEKLKRALNSSTASLDLLIRLIDDLQEKLLSKPSPSAYAQLSNWMDTQIRPNPILCLRPTEKRGLPLTLLHSIFSRFNWLSSQPLPNTPGGARALRVALSLCECMGDAFKKEEIRGAAFDAQMGNFLPGANGARRLKGLKVSGEADKVYRSGGRCLIIREDKVEMGTFGDAYTQVARSFDMACERMGDNEIVPDAPVFLLCLMGPNLLIAGGFKDVDDTVVEPLSTWLIMMKDENRVSGRSMRLATHLYALLTCVEELINVSNPASPSAGLPRVFPSFKDAQGMTRELKFQRRLSTDTLVFQAQIGESQDVCVKIVYGPYGEEVHRLLASQGMAPDLLGVSRLRDGTTAVVMEYLDDSWETLYHFAQSNPRWSQPTVKPDLRGRLESIVSTLASRGLVHGDFRGNNIMVKTGEEKLALLVDFDWAGKGGEVRYPLGRNDTVSWPGIVGSEIHVGHDQTMLGTQWSSLLRDFPR